MDTNLAQSGGIGCSSRVLLVAQQVRDRETTFTLYQSGRVRAMSNPGWLRIPTLATCEPLPILPRILRIKLMPVPQNRILVSSHCRH
jgi:hypothetical protein